MTFKAQNKIFIVDFFGYLGPTCQAGHGPRANFGQHRKACRKMNSFRRQQRMTKSHCSLGIKTWQSCIWSISALWKSSAQQVSSMASHKSPSFPLHASLWLLSQSVNILRVFIFSWPHLEHLFRGVGSFNGKRNAKIYSHWHFFPTSIYLVYFWVKLNQTW